MRKTYPFLELLNFFIATNSFVSLLEILCHHCRCRVLSFSWVPPSSLLLLSSVLMLSIWTLAHERGILYAALFAIAMMFSVRCFGSIPVWPARMEIQVPVLTVM